MSQPWLEAKHKFHDLLQASAATVLPLRAKLAFKDMRKLVDISSQALCSHASLHCSLVLVDTLGVLQAAKHMGGVLQKASATHAAAPRASVRRFRAVRHFCLHHYILHGLHNRRLNIIQTLWTRSSKSLDAIRLQGLCCHQALAFPVTGAQLLQASFVAIKRVPMLIPSAPQKSALRTYAVWWM